MTLSATLVVGAYNMARELPRTLRSLSREFQRDLAEIDYDIIVVDNGSAEPVDEESIRRIIPSPRVLIYPPGNPSPVIAMNAGIAEATGDVIGVLIDGARMASPGMLSLAAEAIGLAPRAVVLTLAFHLGHDVQMKTVLEGYNAEVEDELLESVAWTEDPYRLFDISVLAGSSARGWFAPINESNAIFMRRTMWDELAGFDEGFRTPGGGFANLDLLKRAVALPGARVITLLGEGTFHQVHGGVATNAVISLQAEYHAEYEALRGESYKPPVYNCLLLGRPEAHALASIVQSTDRRPARNLEGR